MNTVETHSYKNWKIEIYQKQPDNFGYHCYGANGEQRQNEGYGQTKDAVKAAQTSIDEQPGENSTASPIKEVGNPTESEISSGEDLNDL